MAKPTRSTTSIQNIGGAQQVYKIPKQENTKGLAGYKMPKLTKPNMKPIDDPTRDFISGAAPQEGSMYSNPVTMLGEVRTPASSQVGYNPNGLPMRRV